MSPNQYRRISSSIHRHNRSRDKSTLALAVCVHEVTQDCLQDVVQPVTASLKLSTVFKPRDTGRSRAGGSSSGFDETRVGSAQLAKKGWDSELTEG